MFYSEQRQIKFGHMTHHFDRENTGNLYLWLTMPSSHCKILCMDFQGSPYPLTQISFIVLLLTSSMDVMSIGSLRFVDPESLGSNCECARSASRCKRFWADIERTDELFTFFFSRIILKGSVITSVKQVDLSWTKAVNKRVFSSNKRIRESPREKPRRMFHRCKVTWNETRRLLSLI